MDEYADNNEADNNEADNNEADNNDVRDGAAHASSPPPPPPPPPPPTAPLWTHGQQDPGDQRGGWGPGPWAPGGSPPYGTFPPFGDPYGHGGRPPYPSSARHPNHGRRTMAALAGVGVLLAAGVAGAAIERAALPGANNSSFSTIPPSGSSGLGNSGSSGLGPGSSGNSGSTGNSGATGNSGSAGNPGSSGNSPAGVNTSAIAAKVDSALVDVTTTLADGGAAAGTGMVLTSSGLVLTNNHVIENAVTINAQLVGGRTYTARVLGYSVTDDVALLQLEGASGLPSVTTGNSSDLSVGQPVVAIGNAGGTGGTPTAVAGTVTALNQTITAGDTGTLSETLSGLIETDADIQPGDSGGPLVNTSGQVIGMDTAASSGNSAAGSQGYAIGIDHALSLANQIKNGQTSASVVIGGSRALLGVEVSGSSGGGGGGFGFTPGSNGSSSGSGAYVSGVQSGSPADSVGITSGDTIVSVNGTTISSAQDLTNALLTHRPGDTVTVGWLDTAGAAQSASVQLASGPPA